MITSDPAPYGPNTRFVRRFLVRLAALGPAARKKILERYALVSESQKWTRAELALAEVMTSSGRLDAQEALGGPLLQLLGTPSTSPDYQLDPIAEPALAALLGLVVVDLLEPEEFSTLYEPFADEVLLADVRA